MNKARKAVPQFEINGKKADPELDEFLESVSYEDVASGSSDTLSVKLRNDNMKWMKKWFPKKGNKIKGKLVFKDWKKDGVNLKLNCGKFTLDEIKFSGGPLLAEIGAVSIPAKESFNSRERTKNWKDVTVKKIAKEIAKRYNLKLSYSGPAIKISSVEQTDKTDSAFLYELCEKYGLSMKVFNNKIVIYDQTKQEKKKPKKTLYRHSFVDDKWDYTESIEGTYTGARISYKSGKSSKETSIYVGLKKEKAAGSRVMNITEVAENHSTAYHMAAAKVNKSNEKAATLSGDIWPNPNICAGITVKLSGLGKIDGKYFVDKSTIEITNSGTTQSLEMHKCQKRLTTSPKSKSKKKKAAAKGNYKVGDVVNFHGGTHYLSSDSGSKGFTAKAGKAKITLKKPGKSHPYHLIHTDSNSNVYGWVDEGSFD